MSAKHVRVSLGEPVEIIVDEYNIVITVMIKTENIEVKTSKTSPLDVEIVDVHIVSDGRGPYPNDVVVESAKVHLRYRCMDSKEGYKKLEIYRREHSDTTKYYAYTIRGYSRKTNSIKAKDIHGDPEGNLYVLLEERRKPYSNQEIHKLIEILGCTTHDIVERNGRPYLKLPAKYSPLIIDGRKNIELIKLLSKVWLTLYEI